MKSIEYYKSRGFTINNTAAGRPAAYKGLFGDPTEIHQCLTELESDLVDALSDMMELIEGTKDTIGLLDVSDTYYQMDSASRERRSKARSVLMRASQG